MIKSIVSGFGRALGRFLFYALIGLLIYFIFDNWEVKALTNTRDIVEVNITTTNFSLGGSNTLTLRPATTGDLFVYENQYFSDRRLNGYYLLGWNEYIFGDYSYYTSNINFYYPNSCNANENVNYNIRIRFYNQDVFTLKPNVTSGSSTCTGTIESIGKDFDYILNCNTRPGSPIIGSLYFTKVGVYPTNYRVSIQKSFNYSCEVNSQAIIENDNINTDRTIQAITDLNGNVTIINNSISEVNSTLTDTSTLETGDISDLTSNSLGDDIINSTRFSDMILLAPQLLESLVINENVCTHYSFGELYGSELRLPCIEPQNYIGTALWTMVDLIFCIALLFPFTRWLAQTLYNIMGLEALNPDTYFGFSDSISRSH